MGPLNCKLSLAPIRSHAAKSLTYCEHWNQVWKEKIVRNIRSEGNCDCVAYWDNLRDAQRYWQDSLGWEQDRIKKMLQSLVLSPHSHVLDIGAGPGVLAIPLAEKVEHVTAVEPSTAMMRVLQENLVRHGLSNVDSVQKRWEKIDEEVDLKLPYDLVIASFSLGMEDIDEAINKMRRVCSDTVCIYWFAGQPSWDVHLRNITRLLHGVDYHPMPACDVLYQMGIYPSITSYPYMQCRRFLSLDDAVEHYSPKYRAKNGDQMALLKRYLQQSVEEEDEGLVMRHSAMCMKISWNKENEDVRHRTVHSTRTKYSDGLWQLGLRSGRIPSSTHPQ